MFLKLIPLMETVIGLILMTNISMNRYNNFNIHMYCNLKSKMYSVDILNCIE